MDHDTVYEEMERMDVGGEDCTLCGKCVEMCPEEGCLSLRFMSKPLVTSSRPRFIDRVGTKGGGGDNIAKETGNLQGNEGDSHA